MHQIKWVSPHALKPNPRNARTHSKKQIRQIANSILAFGFVVPLVADENNTILFMVALRPQLNSASARCR